MAGKWVEEFPEQCWEAEGCCLLPSRCKCHDKKDEDVLASPWSGCGNTKRWHKWQQTLRRYNVYQKSVQQHVGQQLRQQESSWVVLWVCKWGQGLGPNYVTRQIHKLDSLTSGSSSQPNIFSIKYLEWDSFLWVFMTQASSDKRKFTVCELKAISVPN